MFCILCFKTIHTFEVICNDEYIKIVIYIINNYSYYELYFKIKQFYCL